MRKFCVTGGLVVGLLAYATIACALTIDGQNWADLVVEYTSSDTDGDGIDDVGIQNFGRELMSEHDSTQWVTGKSDADPNGNDHFGYGEPDNLGGWRDVDADQHIIVEFYDGLADVAGNDLVIRMFCGNIANASIWGSVDNSDGSYTQIGSIVGHNGEVPGKPKYFYDAEFDFNPCGLDDVHYVKVERITTGSGSGMFFDSFASTAVPEPTTLALLALGCLLMTARWMVIRRRRAG